jgi:presequence protease
VLNEMKGAYQDADRQLMMALNEALLAGSPYAFDSGGKPRDIVQLEYQELRETYEHYYHPSNMSFFFYGQGPIQQELSFLDREYLQSYKDESHRYGDIDLQLSAPSCRHQDIITHTAECNSCSISYLLGPTHDIPPLEAMVLRILSYLLLEKANAEAYKAFVETGTAQNIGFSGLNEGKLTSFVLTLKGIFPHYEARQLEE